MSPSVHHRSPVRRHSSDHADSPVRGRSSPARRRSSPRRERSPVRHRSSPRMERSPARQRNSPRPRSPVRTSSSHRTRSPLREKLPGRVRSLKHVRLGSPVARSPSPRTKRLGRAQAERETNKVTERARSTSPVSGSPSPRTKRLRRAQVERDVDTVIEREREGHSSRDGDKGRHRERGADREVPSERRSTRDKNDGGPSRSRDLRHGNSTSPKERGHRSRYHSRSPLRPSNTGASDEETHARGDEQRDGEYDDSVSKMKAAEEALEAKQKQKPSFELSGKLAAETNRVREPLYVHRQSCYLFGRERRVADIPTDHPSCSKQHAVIQFRLVEKEQPDGMMSKQPRICYLTRELDRLKGASLTSAFLRLLCCVWWHAWNWWNLCLCRFRCHFRQVRLADGIQLSHASPEFQVVTGARISLVICIFVHFSYPKILCFAEESGIFCVSLDHFQQNGV
ncbi:FHA domain-containing protein DDL isoform X2 [Magnolia sinica]|uniref:FHA domain-containing protein DDL isoform X2 n=1 Tax=Magnolia sinica TaxID=86752 RepID=UPI00265AFB0F|nr:FHA domain-containing protein DDL isoform X2 [Magnolia sinica]